MEAESGGDQKRAEHEASTLLHEKSQLVTLAATELQGPQPAEEKPLAPTDPADSLGRLEVLPLLNSAGAVRPEMSENAQISDSETVQRATIRTLAEQLLHSWNSLIQVFRIPRKEIALERRENEKYLEDWNRFHGLLHTFLTIPNSFEFIYQLNKNI